MIDILAQFFGIIGMEITPPETFSELIPYFLQVVLAIGLIVAIFRLFRGIINGLITRNPRV